MTAADTARDAKLNRRLALLLQLGTWSASFIVGLGLVLPSGVRVVTAGIAFFIALPVVGLAVVSIALARRGEYRIALIGAFVVLVVLLGFAVGMRASLGPA